MENILNEQLKRVKLLMEYDTSLTLTDNELVIFEQRQFFRTFTDDAIKTLSAELKGFKMFGNSADAAETFLKNARLGRATAQEMGMFTKEVLKNPGLAKTNIGLFDDAAANYTKQLMNAKGSKAVQFQNATKADRMSMLKNDGYSDAAINRIVKQADDIKPSAVGGKTTVTTTADVATGAAATGKNSGIVKRGYDALKDKLAELKNISKGGWGKVAKWALGLGIPLAAVWYFMQDNGVQAQDTPETPPSDGGKGTSTAVAIPSELADAVGVQKFQDWLDTNKKGWATGYPGGVLNKAGGYGKFGPRTQKQWNDETVKAEYMKGSTPPKTTGEEGLVGGGGTSTEEQPD